MNLVNYKIAETLRDLDYREQVFFYYATLDGSLQGPEKKPFDWNGHLELTISAPTIFEVYLWLIRTHGILITVYSKSHESWMYRITRQGQSLEEGLYGEDYYSPEDCWMDAIEHALYGITNHSI